MTSNLASGEIAEHALELRKEQHENKLIENNRKIIYFHRYIFFLVIFNSVNMYYIFI